MTDWQAAGAIPPRVLFAAAFFCALPAWTVADVLPGTQVDSVAVITPWFSPNNDGNTDRAEFRIAVPAHTYLFSFASPHGQADTLEVLEARGFSGARTSYAVFWDGRVDTLTAFPEGVYDVTFVTQDSVTQARSVNMRQVELDLTPPGVSIVAIEPPRFAPRTGSRSRVLVRFDVTNAQLVDTAGAELIAASDTLDLPLLGGFGGNGRYVAVCDSCRTAVVPDGVHRIEVLASDRAGNRSLATASLDKNSRAPFLTVTGPVEFDSDDYVPTRLRRFALQQVDSLFGRADDRHVVTSVTLGIASPGDTVLVPFAGGTDTTLAFAADVSALLAAEGTYRVSFTLLDEDSVRARVEFDLRIDRTPPTAPIVLQEPGRLVRSRNIEILLGIDSSTQRLIRTGGATAADTVSVTPPTEEISRPLLPGENILTFAAIDSALNVSPATVLSIRWDASAGVVVPERFRAGNEIQINVGDAPAAGVVVSVMALDGTLVQRFEDRQSRVFYRFPWNLQTPDGRRVRNGAYVVVATVDRAGGSASTVRRMMAVVE